MVASSTCQIHLGGTGHLKVLKESMTCRQRDLDIVWSRQQRQQWLDRQQQQQKKKDNGCIKTCLQTGCLILSLLLHPVFLLRFLLPLLLKEKLLFLSLMMLSQLFQFLLASFPALRQRFLQKLLFIIAAKIIFYFQQFSCHHSHWEFLSNLL